MGWRALLVEEAGQDLIEYSLLMAFAAVVVAASFPMGSEAIAAIIAKANASLNRANNSRWQ